MTIFRLGNAQPRLPRIGTFWVAPTATVIGDVRIAPGASIWFGAVVRGDNDPIEIGVDTNVQDNCVLHSDPGIPLSIGARVTIGHGVIAHGCTIGDDSLVGMGSIILNGAKIGRNCLIGAGALITERKIIPDDSVVLGSPGKIVRQITADEAAHSLRSAESYGAKWRRYKANLSLGG